MLKYPWVLMILAGLALAGCGGGEEDGKMDPNSPEFRTVRINLASEPTTLDPAQVDAIAANRALRGLMEGLVWTDGEMQPQPGVAKSWEHNEDYTLWTFHLRQDARWHNGDPVTAHDFKYSAERASTPETGGAYANIVYSFLAGGKAYYDAKGMATGAELDSVRVIDDYTIQYETAFSTPFFLTLVGFAAWYPVHRGVVEEYGNTWSTSPETFMGNGPFKMTAYHSRDKMELVKTDTYWDRDSIFWETVILYMIEDSNTEDQAFRTGSLDVTEGVAVAHGNYWRDRPEYHPVPALATYYIPFNTTKVPFDKKEVRKAFSMTIDRELIVERVLHGQQFIAEGFVPFGMPSPRPGKTYRDVAPNVIPQGTEAEAKALIKEAGYGEDNPLPPVEYLFNADGANKLIAEQMQRMWANAFDVDVRLQNAEFGTVKQEIIKGNFQFARASWFADYADPLNFLELFETGNTKNSAKLSNAKYDELLAKARTETDPIVREDIFIEMEKILVEEECAVAPIYSYSYNFLARTDIENLRMNTLGNLIYPRARRVVK